MTTTSTAETLPSIRGFDPKDHPEVTMCTKTVMDSTDPNIRFDENGVCNWWHEYRAAMGGLGTPEDRKRKLESTVAKIKDLGKNREYDCILGLSGGVDSSYMALLAKELGLRPLVVHFDNGWNSELAVQNIETMVNKLGFKLHTFVMDWPEFRDIQRSYFKASVLDLEVPTDHMIFGALNKIAAKHNIRFILSGNNMWTEFILPHAWFYNKFDYANMRDIHRQYGAVPIRKLPGMGMWHITWYSAVRWVNDFKILDCVEYKKNEVKKQLQSELGWRDYGGQHYESVFTRFYQEYILPNKFNIDKRKPHYSNLICAGELSREDALADLRKPTYDPALQLEDKAFVAKKLGFSTDEFEEVLTQSNRDHREFKTDQAARERYKWFMQVTKPFRLFKVRKKLV